MWFFDKFFGPPKPDKFAKIFMAALRAAGDRRQVSYDPQQFQLAYADKGGYTNLHNFYAEYCATPRKQRPQRLKGQVRGVLSHLKQAPQEFADAAHDLRPRVWARSGLEQMRLRLRLSGDKDLNIPLQHVGEHLAVSLVYDLPESVRTIGQEDLDGWHVNFYEAMEIALRNLRETEFAFAKIGEYLCASATCDSYDASRLLLTDVIRSMQVKGSHVAMTPNRDTLLVTGSDDPTGLAVMLQFAEQALANDPRPMIATPLLLAGDEWVDWTPPADCPSFQAFRKLELKWMFQAYADQKELLDAIHEKEQIGTFVASYSAVEKEGSQDLVSYCVWGQGVDALLPRTHKVVFVQDEAGMAALAPWDKVQQIVGDLMEQTDDYPARFRVREFPSSQQLAALGKEEL